MTTILETEPLPSAEPATPKLTGRVAFVTGGTRGIGAAIARSLANQGATVAVGYSRNRRPALHHRFGKVKLTHRSPDGRASLLTVVGPADMFGTLSTLDAGPRTASAATITAVRAGWMDRDAIHAWMTNRPESAEQLLQLLARQLRRNDTYLTELISTDTGRVARQLLALALRFGTYEDGELRVVPDLTQEEIAQMIGSSRETVNKTLASFATVAGFTSTARAC